MSIPSLSLRDKVALVTGSRRGIGRVIALAFAEAGADVVVCDQISEDGELGATAQEIRKLGQRSLTLKTDISRKVDVDILIKNTLDQFGSIDILVNNAAIQIPGSLTKQVKRKG